MRGAMDYNFWISLDISVLVLSFSFVNLQWANLTKCGVRFSNGLESYLDKVKTCEININNHSDAEQLFQQLDRKSDNPGLLVTTFDGDGNLASSVQKAVMLLLPDLNHVMQFMRVLGAEELNEGVWIYNGTPAKIIHLLWLGPYNIACCLYWRSLLENIELRRMSPHRRIAHCTLEGVNT